MSVVSINYRISEYALRFEQWVIIDLRLNQHLALQNIIYPTRFKFSVLEYPSQVMREDNGWPVTTINL